MQIIKADDADYAAIASLLKQGHIIIYPTDTAYALGADATNEQGVALIFDTKQRDRNKTLSMIVADQAMVKAWLVFSARASELADQHWPGPLSLTLPVRKEGLASAAMQEGFASIRVPDEYCAASIARSLGAPVISTSANASGSGPQYSLDAVIDSLGERASLVSCALDAGTLPNIGVSTIVKVWNNKIIVLRKGAVNINPAFED